MLRWADDCAASIITTPVTINEMTELKKVVDVRHKECEVRFDSLKSTKELSEANRKVLSWITEVDMAYVHRKRKNRLDIDDKYKFCGQWLLVSETYRKWLQSDVFAVYWLCGTGEILNRGDEVLLILLLSGHWEINSVVG